MMKHRWVVAILGLLAVVLLLAVAVVWYQAATLKTRLADSLGQALKARVEVGSIALDLWKGELHAANITLINQRPEAPWDKGEISQATVHFHLRDLLAPQLPLAIEVSSWRVTLHSAAGAGPSVSRAPALVSNSAPENESRHGIQVTQLSAANGDVEVDLSGDRQILIHGVAFQSSDNGAQVWTTQVQAASITAGSLLIGASSVELRSNPDKITFSNLRMQCATGGITGEGEAGLTGAHALQATLKAVDVPASMLVAVKWQMKLSGLVSGTLTYRGDDLGAQAQGQLSVAQGKFNILPFLGKMASVVGLPDITGMEVDKATTDFAWQNRVLHFTNLDVRKNDITRIAGQVDVAQDGQVDGHLKLGLPNSILTRWPQLQAGVFSVPFEDYGWAEVHLTGTPDHLQEDLSARVLAAGIQGGNGLINQGTQKAEDLLKSLMSP